VPRGRTLMPDVPICPYILSINWNLIQVPGERAKCNRGRAYNEYKESCQINKRGFNLTVL